MGVMVKILLADDDKGFGRVLKNELEGERHHVDLVDDGVKAVLSFIEHAYEFVILDLKMPRLDGNDALKIIKKLNPNIPVVTISGNAGETDVAESLNCGALKCLIKPFRIEQLKYDIRNFLGEKR
jgi:two-component system nitrogen regulation response regulator NtrX